MRDWETVDSVPARVRPGRDGAILTLKPGQIVRRVVIGKSGGGNNVWMARKGPDYHSGQRTVDGQRYLYIWRDPLPGGES